MTISRRSFLRSAAIGITGTAVVGLAGCSPAKNDAPASEGNGAQAAESDKKDIKNTLECDICVVGAGFSGMISAIQATEDGARVIVLESDSKTGGASANGVEGSLSIDSKIAKEQGITVDIKEILMSEMAQSQWRADGLAWLEMMENSGKNMDWLLDQGVKVDKIDNYHGKDYNTFHWYEGGITEGYINPMTKKMEQLGIQIEYSMKAEGIIQDDAGRVTGVYATDKSGACTQVNAKAVILATGGFGANYELCSQIGYDADRIQSVGSPNDDGSGHDIAVTAGAKDIAYYAADNCGSIIKSFGFSMPNLGFCMAPQIPWINESCERFYKEDNCAVNLSLANPPKWNQERSFMIWDQGIFDAYAEGQDDLKEMLEKGLSSSEKDICKANTLEELAKNMGLDATQLKTFVDDYNSMCDAGVDLLWNKAPESMIALRNPPYYMARPIVAMFTTIGGVATNRNAQAIDEEHHAIEGLYVVGVEGCMLYRNVYTIGTPGSCSGNSINTARVAAKHAVEHCL